VQGYWKDSNKFIKDKLPWYVKNNKLERTLNKVYVWQGDYCESFGGWVGDFYDKVPIKTEYIEKQIFLVTVEVFGEENDWKQERESDVVIEHKVLAYRTTEWEGHLYDYAFIPYDEWNSRWYEMSALNSRHNEYYNDQKQQRKFWARDWWKDEHYSLNNYFRWKWYNNGAEVTKVEPYLVDGLPQFVTIEEETFLNSSTPYGGEMLDTKYYLKDIRVDSNTVKRLEWSNVSTKEDKTYRPKTSQDIYSDKELKAFKSYTSRVGYKYLSTEDKFDDDACELLEINPRDLYDYHWDSKFKGERSEDLDELGLTDWEDFSDTTLFYNGILHWEWLGSIPEKGKYYSYKNDDYYESMVEIN